MPTSPVTHLVPGGTLYMAYAATANENKKPAIKLMNAVNTIVLLVRPFILFTENTIWQIGANSNNNNIMVMWFTLILFYIKGNLLIAC